MNRNPMTMVLEERNEDGEIVVEKSINLIPRAIIGVNPDKWEDYCDEVDNLNHTVLLHMSEEREVKEKTEIIQKLLGQIEAFSKGNIEYRKKTERIKELLEQELELIKI